MAHPGDEPLDDVVEALKKLGAQTEQTRKAVDDAKREASRTGGTIVPTTRAPTVVASVKESKQIIAAAQAESAAHSSLARAIEAHETARLRLADARRRLKAIESTSTPEATLASGRLQREIEQMRQQASGLLSDVNIKRGTLSGLVGQETAGGYEKTYRTQFREIVKEKLRTEAEQTAAAEKGADDRVKVAEAETSKHASEFEKRRDFIRQQLTIEKTEGGKVFVGDPRNAGRAYIPEGRQRASYFGGAGGRLRAESERTQIAAELARQGEFVTEKELERARKRVAGLPASTQNVDAQVEARHARERLAILEDLYNRERGIQAQAEEAKTQKVERESERRAEVEAKPKRGRGPAPEVFDVEAAVKAERAEEGLIAARTRSGKLLQELQHHTETYGDTADAQAQRISEGLARISAGQKLSLAQAREAGEFMRGQLGEGGTWNPMHDWGGTGKPRPGERAAAERVLQQLQEGLDAHTQAEEAKTAKTQQESKKRAEAEKPIPLPEGPAASQQRTEQRVAAQEAAWNAEMDRRLRVEGMRTAGANQYAQPIGPQQDDALASRVAALRDLDSRLEDLGRRAAAIGPPIDGLFQGLNERLEDIGRRAAAVGPPLDTSALRERVEPIRLDLNEVGRAVGKAVEPLFVQRTAPYTRGEMIQQGQVHIARQRHLDEQDPTRPIQRRLDEAQIEMERLEREYQELSRSKFRRKSPGQYQGALGMEIMRQPELKDKPWVVAHEGTALDPFRTLKEAQTAGREWAREMSHDVAEAQQSQRYYIQRLQDDMTSALSDIERQARRTAAATAAGGGQAPPPIERPTAVAPEPEPERRRPPYTPIDRPFTYPVDAAERTRRIEALRNSTSLGDSARALAARFNEAATAADRARLPTRAAARGDIAFGHQEWPGALGITGEPSEFQLRRPERLSRGAAAADIEAAQEPPEFRRNIRESFAGAGDALAQRLAPHFRSQAAAATAMQALTTVVRSASLRQIEGAAGPTQAELARGLSERIARTQAGRIPSGPDLREAGDLPRSATQLRNSFASLADSSRALSDRLELSREAVEAEAAERRRAGQVGPLRRDPPYVPILPGGPPPVQPPPPPPPVAPPPPPPPPPPPGSVRPVVFGHERFSTDEAKAALAGTERADEALDSYNRTVQRSIQIESEHAAALQASRVEQSRAVSQFSALSNAYKAHGAATTEFLAALGRGDASIREIGWQALATAGKFGAWTAASVGVFGAMTALAQVGHGAIESMSGVNELSRYISDLNTEDAQRQFRDLSAEFNLPIEDVTAAFAQMGRVFGTQTQAFEGARAVLLATRVGNLEVADSARFLSAIFQGFQIPAQQTTTVIDQINAAQNNLNFSIRDGSAGIARAAGSWKAAGGTFSELLAIMATAQRATGATGEVVGTAFRRSAEFVGREANQAQLRGFGIDPTRGVDETYRQAFAKVESGQVRGPDITKLATALSSPQLAAVISPTLQSFKRYREALRETNAEAARGSARNELAIQLDAVRERLAAVGNQLEQLGSNLAQSGAISGLGLMLETINLSLTAANNLLEIFNELPKGVRVAVTGLAQAYAVMRLMRRLNVGTFLTENAAVSGGRYAQGLRPLGQAITGDPARATFRRALASLTEEMAYFRAESEKLGRGTASRSTAATAAQRRVEEYGRRGPDLTGIDLDSVEGQRAAMARQQQHDIEINRLQRVAEKAAEDRALAASDELAVNQHLIAIEKRNAEIRRIGARNAEAGLAALRATGVTPVPVAGYVPSLERPTTERVTSFQGHEVPILGLQTQTRDAVMEDVEASRRAIATGAADGVAAATSGAGRVATSATGVRRAGSVVAGAGRGLGLALRGVALAASAFLPELAIVGGLVFGPMIYSKIKENQQRQREKMDRLTDTTASLVKGGYDEQIAAAHEAADDRLERERKAQAEIDLARRHPGTPVSIGAQATARGLDRLPGEQAGIDALNRETERQRRIKLAQDQQRAAFARQRATGRPQEIPFIPFQDLEDIFQGLPVALANLGRGVKATTGAAALMRRYGGAINASLAAETAQAPLEEIIGGRSQKDLLRQVRSLGIGKDEVLDSATVEEMAKAMQGRAASLVAAANQQLRDAVSTALSPRDVLAFDASRSYGEIANQLGAEVLAIQALGGSRQRLQTAGVLFSQAIMHLGSRQDPDALKAYIENQQKLDEALTASTQATIRDMAAATTPRQRTRVFERGLTSLQGVSAANRRAVTGATTGVSDAQAAVADAQARRDDLKAKLNSRFGKGFNFKFAPFAQGLDLSSGLKQAEADLAAAQVTLDAKQEELSGAKKAVKDGLKLTNAQVGSLIQNYLSQDVLQQSKVRVTRARVGGDPIAAARVDRDEANRQLRSAEKLHRGNQSFRRSAEYQTLLNNARAGALEAQIALDAAIEAGSKEAMDQLSLMQSRSSLAVSFLPRKGASRGRAILYGKNGLYAQLETAKRTGADEATRNGIQESINDQLNDNAEQAQQTADDAAQAAEDARQKAEEARQKQRDRISALYQYKRSLTDNPVILARLEEQEATAIMGVGGDATERLRDKAARNEAKRRSEQAVNDRKIENLEYQHDIGKLTDEAFIAGLRGIMRTMDKGSEARRQLRMRIGRLKHELESDKDMPELNVGNIRLPTAYDVRRFVRQGTQTAPANVQQANTYNFSVRSESDIDAIGGHLGRIHDTHWKAGARAAGLRG
jgi:TP901 family phage tail tape measure protein